MMAVIKHDGLSLSRHVRILELVSRALWLVLRVAVIFMDSGVVRRRCSVSSPLAAFLSMSISAQGELLHILTGVAPSGLGRESKAECFIQRWKRMALRHGLAAIVVDDDVSFLNGVLPSPTSPLLFVVIGV